MKSSRWYYITFGFGNGVVLSGMQSLSSQSFTKFRDAMWCRGGFISYVGSADSINHILRRHIDFLSWVEFFQIMEIFLQDDNVINSLISAVMPLYIQINSSQ